MNRKQIFTVLLLIFTSKVLANVHYIETNGENKRFKEGVNFLPNHSGLRLHLISGLDRRVVVDITSESGTNSYDLGVVGIRDSLEVNGEKFYGKTLEIGHLVQNAYTINVTQLDTQGNTISATVQQLTVDEEPPTLGNIFWNSFAYKLSNVPNNQWLGDFEVWNWGASNVNDQLSGIDKIIVYATNRGETTPLQSPIEMAYNQVSKEARQGGAPNIFPTYERDYTIHIDAYDKAGNIGKTTRDITWTGPGYLPELVGINDGTYSGNFLPGSPYTGYKAYTPGMEVGNYNFKLVYRMPYEWANPANPGRLYSYWGQYNTTEYVKDGYAYFHVQTVYSKGDPRTHEITIGRHDRWVSHFLYHDLNLAPHLAKQPVAVKQEYFVNGVGWVNYGHHMLGLANQNDKPTQFRVTAEPRPYIQRVFIQEHGAGGGYSNCVIPVNGTTCQASLPTQYVDWKGANPAIPNDQILIRHFWMNKIVKDDFRDLKSSNLGGMNFTIDKTVPRVTKSLKKPYSNEYQIYALKDFSGEDWNRVQMSKVGLRITDTSNKTIDVWVDGNKGQFSLNGKVVPLGGAFMDESIPLPQLENGLYNIELMAQDTAWNITTVDLGHIQYETENPIIELGTIENIPLQNASITKLDQILFSVNDANDYLIESVLLTGGAANDEFELKLVATGNDNYRVETPRVFPTLIENEWYTLTVAAVDDFGNRTIANSKFKYIPENIITLGSLITLPVSVPLLKHDDSPVTSLTFNPMTVEGGQMASGIHDYYLTVRSDSKLPISVDGVSISPGETKLLSVDFGEGDRPVTIPVATSSSIIATSDIMVEIPKLSSKYE
ncbi:Ig-like domain-containing protein [Vibrio sp. 10N.239.312.D08]|uniref:Ig-like domain-containing protein n=1 Tax=Vibrio sp. 10N.239.312.D08 TaxID=3229978 RepID=UPI00354B53AB